MRIEVVTHIEVIRESVTSELLLVPRARGILPLQQPSDAAPDVLANGVLTGEQTDQRPRRLRGSAGSATAPTRVLVALAALAPSALGVLLRLQPADRAPNPRLAKVDADRAQPEQRGEGAIYMINPPSPPP